MKSYEQATRDLSATHASQRGNLRAKQDAAIKDQMREHGEEWASLDRQHARDWFELRKQHKKPIGPAGLAMLAGVTNAYRR